MAGRTTRFGAVLDVTLELVAGPSENPPGDEAAVAEWLAAHLDVLPAPFAGETTHVEPTLIETTPAESTPVDADRVGFDASTDARFLAHDAGTPTVHFGPGSIAEDAHTVDESVSVADLMAAVFGYEALLERSC